MNEKTNLLFYFAARAADWNLEGSDFIIKNLLPLFTAHRGAPVVADVSQKKLDHSLRAPHTDSANKKRHTWQTDFSDNAENAALKWFRLRVVDNRF